MTAKRRPAARQRPGTVTAEQRSPEFLRREVISMRRDGRTWRYIADELGIPVLRCRDIWRGVW